MEFNSINSNINILLNIPNFNIVTTSTDITKLEAYIKTKNINTIIKDQELFWLTFCKALSFVRKGSGIEAAFSVSVLNTSLTISGRESVIKGVQKIVEIFRQHFNQGLVDRKNVEIHICESKLDPTDFCNITDGYGSSESYFSGYYHQFVKPALPQLANYCCASYREAYPQNFVLAIDFTVKDGLFRSEIHHITQNDFENKIITSVQINWHFPLYPIEPKRIEPKQPIDQGLHEQYQNQICCDLALTFQHQTIRIHSCVLYQYGGEAFRKMLTNEMKEKKDKVIFLDYSEGTILAFVDFLYLGGDGFLGQFFESKMAYTIDPIELFEFANTYQINILIDCSTNLMTHFVTDIERIKNLKDRYPNDHLEHLHSYLFSRQLLKVDDFTNKN